MQIDRACAAEGVLRRGLERATGNGGAAAVGIVSSQSHRAAARLHKRSVAADVPEECSIRGLAKLQHPVVRHIPRQARGVHNELARRKDRAA